MSSLKTLPPKFWTPARIADLQRRWERDDTQREIAIHFCVDDDVIKLAVETFALPKRTPAWRVARAAQRTRKPAQGCIYFDPRSNPPGVCGRAAKGQYCADHQSRVAPLPAGTAFRFGGMAMLHGSGRAGSGKSR